MTTGRSLFEDATRLGQALAERICDGLASAGSGAFVLGCPTGRSPLPTYRAFGPLAARRGLDLSRLHLVMMDEYVEREGAHWRLCDPARHYSCAGFAEREIRSTWNAGLPDAHHLPAGNVHFPDPEDPQAFERRIADLGGIDLFLLASGESDGHVAFNPAGVPLAAQTRLIELAETTRRDNMESWPAFRSLSQVPTHGVSVGPGTIQRWSRSAVLILAGAAKARAYQRITQACGYETDWPATIVHACQQPEIYADRQAAKLKETQLCDQ